MTNRAHLRIINIRDRSPILRIPKEHHGGDLRSRGGRQRRHDVMHELRALRVARQREEGVGARGIGLVHEGRHGGGAGGGAAGEEAGGVGGVVDALDGELGGAVHVGCDGGEEGGAREDADVAWGR